MVHAQAHLAGHPYQKLLNVSYHTESGKYGLVLCILMACPLYNILEIVHCSYLGVSGYNVQTIIVFLCMKVTLPFQTVLTLMSLPILYL